MNIYDNGFEIESDFISQQTIESIKQELSESVEKFPKHGIRHANQKFKSIQSLCESQLIISKAESILNAKANLVRVIFFDKTDENNWYVTWHQDKTICVSDKKEIEGWSAWTLKDGKHHVQPSLDVLNNMVAFRVHLDDADVNNGCLKVLPDSHKNGIMNQAEIDVISKNTEYMCEVKAGGVLMMRPHILHASSKSKTLTHRRVVHIEFSSYALPFGMDWGG